MGTIASKPDVDRYRLMAEHSTDMISTHTPEGNYTYVSPACRALLGYEPEDLVGRSPYELFHPDDLAAVRSTHTSLTHRPDVYTIAYRIRRADGAFTWMESTCKPICDDANTVREIICVSRDISDRMHAEETRAESVRLARNILDSSPTRIAVIDERGWIVNVNRAWREFAAETGAGEASIGVGVDYLGVCDRAAAAGLPSAAAAAAALRAVLTGAKKEVGLEYSWEGADGPVWFLAQFSRFAEPGPPRAMVAHVDITQRKRVEVELVKTLERFNLMVDGSQAGLWDAVVNADDPYNAVNPVYWSPRLKALLGFQEHEFEDNVGAWSSRLHPDDRDRIFAALDDQLWRRKPYDVEYRMLTKSGEVRWFAARGLALWDEAGKPVRISGSLADITDRKRAEEALRDSEARLRSILNNTTAVIYIKDLEGKYLLINTRYEELFHVTKAQILGKTDHDIFPASAADAFRVNDLHVLRTRAPLEIEEVAPHDDGPHWYVTVKFPLNDAAGEPYAVCGISTDITDRRHAEERARHLQSEITHVSRLAVAGEMAAELAHELNQPLAAIAGYAQAALKNLQKVPGVQDDTIDSVRKAEEQARRAGQVIHHLAAFVRKREPRRSTASINEVLAEVTALANASARHANVTVRFVLAAGLPPLLMDRIQIQQVVLNLVRNAADAVESDGAPGQDPIIVRTTLRPPGSVEVAVEDRGPGLSGADANRLFQAFYTTKPTGMGLGLAISRTIIEGHGGRLWAEPNSAAPGAANGSARGAVFRFTLPSHPGDQPHGR